MNEKKWINRPAGIEGKRTRGSL